MRTKRIGGALALIASAALTACGGGDDQRPDVLLPDGSAPSLHIAQDNHLDVARLAVTSAAFLTDNATSIVEARTGALRAAAERPRALHASTADSPAIPPTAREQCAGGGVVEFYLDDFNANRALDAGESVRVRAQDCLRAGVRTNGLVDLKVDSMTGSFDRVPFTARLTMGFIDFSAAAGNNGFTGNGQLRLVVKAEGPERGGVSLQAANFALQARIGGTDYLSALTNFDVVVDRASVAGGSQLATGVRGRLQSAAFGSQSVDIETIAVLTRAPDRAEPEAGSLQMHGAGGSRVRVTAQPDGMALIELDANGDGRFEQSSTRRWSEFR